MLKTDPTDGDEQGKDADPITHAHPIPAANVERAIRLFGEALTLLGIDPRASHVRRLLAGTRGRRKGRRGNAVKPKTVSWVCRRYMEHANTYYADSDGSSAREADNIGLALRVLRKL